MKNVFKIILVLAIALTSWSSTALACAPKAKIEGPSGNCVAEQTPLTYTSSHDFPVNAACTYYEWKIEGGTVIGPTGVSVTNGTLCLSEGVECNDWDIKCTETAIWPDIASGSGVPVTVVWSTPESGKGKITFTAREITYDAEGEKIEDKAKDKIEINNSTREPTSIVRSNIQNNSSTFAADLPDDVCPGTVVNWTFNGQPQGTGNPITLPIGRCESGNVCAFTTFGGVSSEEICIFVGFNPQPGSITGPDQVNLEQAVNFSLSAFGAPNISNVLWTIKPNLSGQILNGQGSTSITAIFFNPSVSFVDVCVSGDWLCGTFDLCKRVFIASGGVQAPNDDPSKVRPFIATNEDYQSLNVFPSLLKAGGELTINFPTYDQMVDVTITDLQGRVVFQNRTDQAQVLFPTADLAKGMYVVSVNGIAGLESQKIIIE
ncbi:MAG: T9SS type A sorting domain-containing protein [Bacteroidota bacterium]